VYRIFSLALIAALFLPGSSLAQDPLAPYYEPAGRILGEALLSGEPYEDLGILCDRYGNRLSGSARLDAAIDWVIETMREQGLENVHREEVMVPHWVRGEERAWLNTATYTQELSLLGLGMSVGTPPEGVEAEVVVVGWRSWDARASRGRSCSTMCPS
jgi:carboxypeptidase Q